mgnify:FL=1
MKKHLLTISAFLLGATTTFAQIPEEIDIQAITPATGGSQTLIVDSAEENTNVYLIMTVFNSFSNSSNVNNGDTLIFDWTVDGGTAFEEIHVVSGSIMNLQTGYLIFQNNYSVGTEGTRTICASNTYNPAYGDVSNVSTEVCDDFRVFASDTGGTGGVSVRDLEVNLGKAAAFFSHDKLFLSMDTENQELDVDVQVVDLTGQVVMEEKMILAGGGLQSRYYDFGAQAKGIYLVNLQANGIRKSLKVVKY